MPLFNKNTPQTIEVLGKQLRCPICDNDRFWIRKAQLNTALATFLGFDWANESATCVVCVECTHISWFLE